MSESSDDKMRERLHQVFNNPDTESAVVDAVVHNRPRGWGRRSIAPYFKERFGKEMQQIFDAMIVDLEDRVFHYDYFQEKFSLSKNSLYLRVNQSIRYLVEKLDTPEHTYGKFYETLVVERVRGVGVIIRRRPECNSDFKSDFTPKPVLSKSAPPTWRQELDTFLEESKPGDAPFCKEKLSLSPEEIEDVKVSLAGVSGILCNVTSYSIKIIRVNEGAVE